MIKEFGTFIKYFSIVAVVLIGVISCEKDFNNVGVNIVDNNTFTADVYTSKVIAFNKNIERNRSHRLVNYLLGTQQDPVFGKLEASIVTQLGLPEANPDFGVNAVIEKVVLEFPYTVTKDGEHENGSPKFTIDSLWSSGDKSFQLNIFELGSFLNEFDPIVPEEHRVYYSDDSFIKLDEMYSDVVTANPTDTMYVVDRYKYPNYPLLTDGILYKKDTIKRSDGVTPSLKVYFDNDFIKDKFQTPATNGDFSSDDAFKHLFRGLYIEALANNPDNSALLLLTLSKATMTIYYSESEVKDEGENEDLDGNGTNGESNVLVGTPKNFIFPLSGTTSNLFTRDYTGAIAETYITNPDVTNGEDKLFVQGASGTDVIFKLFGEDVNSNDVPDELEVLRTKNWLINDAQLIFYVDGSNPTTWYPNRLYLYNIGEDNNLQTYDAMRQGAFSIGGNLEKDSDSNPLKYTFHITDYISEIIKDDSDAIIRDFGLKVYYSTTSDEPQSANDTILSEYNGNQKAVVLKGNLPNTDEERIKLVLYYTQKNN